MTFCLTKVKVADGQGAAPKRLADRSMRPKTGGPSEIEWSVETKWTGLWRPEWCVWGDPLNT